jgi:pentatricopeptide repeat protein
MQDATTRGDEEKALNLLELYHEAGGEKQLWMFDMLINMHGRKRNLPGALEVRKLMHSFGLKGSTSASLPFSILITFFAYFM